MLPEPSEIKDWVQEPNSVADNISFEIKMIDHGWKKVFSDKGVLGFIARNTFEINALHVTILELWKAIGKALPN